MNLYENYLRKVQAASVIANTVGYAPAPDEQPEQIVANALEQHKDSMSDVQRGTIQDVLKLMEAEKDIGDLSDEELDKLVHSLDDEEILAEYEDDETEIVDEETGEVLETEPLDDLNEILSRVERMRAKMRMIRTKTKRQAKAKIALHKHSNSATINKRARRLAIKAIKKKFAKKSLDKLSITDKERLEKLIASRKALINRLAMKMVPRMRKLEKERLSK
jgi:hypothetical protein